MKTIGLLGGMSWESTIPYYRQINQRIKQQLGGLHSGKIVLYSVDFAQIEELQRSGDWDKAGELLADAAIKLQTAGADCIVLWAAQDGRSDGPPVGTDRPCDRAAGH